MPSVGLYVRLPARVAIRNLTTNKEIFRHAGEDVGTRAVFLNDEIRLLIISPDQKTLHLLDARSARFSLSSMLRTGCGGLHIGLEDARLPNGTDGERMARTTGVNDRDRSLINGGYHD
jgi:hypothetical protein